MDDSGKAPIRVAVFAPLRYLTPESTGAGKHIIQMVRGLADDDDFQVSMLAGRDELDAGRIPAGNPLAGVPAVALPGPRRLFEWAWKAVGKPRADRWCRGADWVYCPAEAVVPVRDARLAVTVHDLNYFEPDLPWSNSSAHQRARMKWQATFRQIRKFATRYLTVSEFSKSRIVELLQIDPTDICVVGNGVEDVFFGPPAEPSEPPYILVVGGLTRRKGGDFVLRIADRLADSSPKMTIKVAGASESELAAVAAGRANIRELGVVSARDLPNLVRGAVALFFPSRYEGFGIPAVEAMATGTPVVCSDRAGLPEVVGSAAVLIGLEDVQPAADALVRLAEDSSFRADLVRRGQERAELFRWNACVRRLTEALSLP